MKRLIKLAFGLSIMTILTSCGTTDNTPQNTMSMEEKATDISDTLGKINTANTLTLEKKISFMNTQWKIKADGDHVADINGKVWTSFGEELVVTSTNGVVLGSEKQLKRYGGFSNINRMAEISDYKGDITGYIGEQVFNNMFSYTYRMHIYDADKKEIANTKKEVFSMLNSNSVMSDKGDLLYKIKGQFSYRTTYTITVEDNSVLDNLTAIYFTVIQDAINEAQEDEEDN